MKSHILTSEDRIRLKEIIKLYGINFLINVVTGKQILLWRFSSDNKFADRSYWEKLNPYFDSILFENEWLERHRIDDKIRSRITLMVKIYGYKYLIHQLSLSCNTPIKNWQKSDSLFITKTTWSKMFPFLNSTIYMNGNVFYLPHLDPRISVNSMYDANYRWKEADNKNISTIIEMIDDINANDLDQRIDDYMEYHKLMEQFEKLYLNGIISKQKLNKFVNETFLDNKNKP